jgi:hypothetical protein
VFYLLSNKCFKIIRSEYEFEVCPFKRTTQIKRNNAASRTNIGSKPNLYQSEKLKWILKMENGDAGNCPASRQSQVK